MKQFVLTAAGACLLAGSAQADLVGLWQFENAGNLGAATVGSDLAATGAITATAGSGGPDTGAASVDAGEFYSVTNTIGGNGGGANTNQFSVVMDINTTTGGFQALLDFETVVSTDGDLFLNDSGIGISGDYDGTVPSGDWARIVAVYDLTSADAPISLYVNGSLANVVEAPSGAGVDQRYSLRSSFDILSDNGGGEEATTGLSNLALFDTALSASDVASLGGAGRAITNVPEPTSLALLGLGGLLVARRRRNG